MTYYIIVIFILIIFISIILPKSTSNKKFFILESKLYLNINNRVLYIILWFTLYVLCSIIILMFYHDVVYAASPDNLAHFKDMIEYYQDQIHSIDETIKQYGLDKNDTELSADQLQDKSECLEAKNESEINRKHYMKEYSEAKSRSESSNDSINPSNKRQHNDPGVGPSKR